MWSKGSIAWVLSVTLLAACELGRAVAARVIEHMKISGEKWAGAVPAGRGLWKGTNPVGVDDVG